jgi:hypothetical protein
LSEILEVRSQTFLGLVEGFLSENRTLYLIVEGMTVTKDFGCDYCGATITASSPDDRYTVLSLKPEGESVERKIKCEKCEKKNTRYWLKESQGVYVRSSG